MQELRCHLCTIMNYQLIGVAAVLWNIVYSICSSTDVNIASTEIIYPFTNEGSVYVVEGLFYT
jgi:hypothetical protein